MRMRTVLPLGIGIALTVGGWIVHRLYLNVPVSLTLLDYTVETPLTILMLLALLLALLLNIVWQVVSLVIFLPSHVRRWRLARADRKRSQLLANCLKELALGNPAKQVSAFTTAGAAKIEAALCYFMAATVADERDQEALLRKAVSSSGDPMILAMASAQACLRTKRPEEAAEILRAAGVLSGSSIRPLQLMFESCTRADNLALAFEAGRELAKIAPSTELHRQMAVVAEKLLAQSGADGNIAKHISALGKSHPPLYLLLPGAKLMAAHNDLKGASKILAQALKEHTDPDLFETISTHGSDELVSEALSKGEDALKSQTDNADLLRSIGMLAMRRELWGQAHKYLERAAQLKPEALNFQRLAELAKSENKPDTEINRLYRRAAGIND